MHITALEKILITAGLDIKGSKVIDDYFLTGKDGAIREEYRSCQEDIAERMIELSELKGTDMVLEPSAGHGVILKKLLHLPLHQYCEINMGFYRDYLKHISSHFRRSDFLKVTTSYDKIVMNPPFSFRQYVTHIDHAWKLLRRKGILVFLYPKNAELLLIQNKEFIEFLTGVEKIEVGNVCGLCECVIGKIVKP